MIDTIEQINLTIARYCIVYLLLSKVHLQTFKRISQKYVHDTFFTTDSSQLIILFGVTGIYLYNTLTITEIVVIKTLYLYKYSRIASMNEYFITTMLTSFNFLIIGSNIVIRISLKEYEGNPFYNFLMGQHAEKLEFHKIVNFL